MTATQILLPVIVAVIAAILAAMIGMALSGIREIKDAQKEQNGKLFAHITNASIHEAAFARTDEQLKQLVATVNKAHERIDEVKKKGCDLARTAEAELLRHESVMHQGGV